ncbi:MAG: hypothetical protein ACLQNE_22610 [Thermoguttaceae bacterium]
MDIRRDDGTPPRVAMEKFSEEDQKYVRKLATPVGESAFAVTADEAKPSVNPKGPVAGGDTQTVFAEGVGSTKEEALKDAFRAAVRQVVGEVVDGETLVKNEELVKDQVLTYSDGFIPEHMVTSEKQDNGLFRVGIRAKVQRRSVIMKLKAANITLKSFDGESLYGSIVTQLTAEGDAAELLRNALTGFPTNVVKARATVEPKPLEESRSGAELGYNLEISADVSAFDTFQQKLVRVLDQIAVRKGECFAQSVEHDQIIMGPGDLRYVLSSPDSKDTMQPSQLFRIKLHGEKLGFGNAWNQSPPLNPKTEMIFVVNTKRTALHDRTTWKWYHTVRPGALRAGVVVDVRFLDSDSREVAMDQMRLNEQPGLYLYRGDYFRGRVAIAYILPYWQQETSLGEWQPGYFASATFARKIKLSLPEIESVRAISCKTNAVE